MGFITDPFQWKDHPAVQIPIINQLLGMIDVNPNAPDEIFVILELKNCEVKTD